MSPTIKVQPNESTIDKTKSTINDFTIKRLALDIMIDEKSNKSSLTKSAIAVTNQVKRLLSKVTPTTSKTTC